MKKRLELANPHSCFNRAEPDEPIFVLRSSDPIGPQTVRLWATMATLSHSAAKVEEAMMFADEMEKWRNESGYNDAPKK